MVYTVTVVPKSKHERVVHTGDAQLKVYVTVAPEKGKANDAMMTLLREHFHVPKSAITLIQGKKCRVKKVDIVL